MIGGQNTGILLVYFLIIICAYVCIPIISRMQYAEKKVIYNKFRDNKCERRHDTLTARVVFIKVWSVTMLETV